MAATTIVTNSRVRRLNSGHWQSRGLVGQWIFDGVASHTNLVDSSRNNFVESATLEKYYSPALRTGRKTTSSNYLYAGTTSVLDATTFTVMMWFDASIATSGFRGMLSKPSGTYPTISGWMFYLNNSTVYFAYGNGSSWPRQQLSATYSGSGPVMIAASRGPSTDYLWINGVQATSGASALFSAASSTNLAVGRTLNDGTYYPTWATQVRYYNTQLTSAEIAAIYRSPFGNVEQNRRSVIPFQTPIVLTCATGSFSYTGNAANLKATRKVPASVGSFAFTGQAASPKVTRKVTAGTGSFSYDGQDASLLISHNVVCATGSFAFTGNDANVSYVTSFVLESGSFSFISNDADLIVTPGGGGGGDVTLACETTNYAFTGGECSLKIVRKVAAGTGSFSLSGKSAYLRMRRKIAAATGEFAFTGNAANLRKTSYVACAAGVFSLTGNATGLKVRRKVVCGTGSYSLTGNAATVRRVAKISAGTGSFTFTGNPANLTFRAVVSAETGSFTFTGNDATITVGATSCPALVDVGEVGSAQREIAGDWEFIDGIELLTMRTYGSPTTSVSCVRALCGSLTKREVAMLSNSSMGLEPDDLAFSIWITSLNSVEPQRHNTLTRDDDSVYTILSATKLTLDTRWRVLCRKQVST